VEPERIRVEQPQKLGESLAFAGNLNIASGDCLIRVTPFS
jgi:hypothetical protein